MRSLKRILESQSGNMSNNNRSEHIKTIEGEVRDVISNSSILRTGGVRDRSGSGGSSSDNEQVIIQILEIALIFVTRVLRLGISIHIGQDWRRKPQALRTEKVKEFANARFRKLVDDEFIETIVCATTNINTCRLSVSTL
jgi:hypothetical protein